MSDHVVVAGNSEYHIGDQKKYDELIDFLEANAEVVVERDEEENKDLLIEIEQTDGVHTGPKIVEDVEDEDEDQS
jgi:hypothetical protein